jgi:DNA mismatch repair ATPase MutS
VAKLAGLPRVVTDRAEEILKDLEERGVNIIRPAAKRLRVRGVRTALSQDPAQLGLFRESS